MGKNKEKNARRKRKKKEISRLKQQKSKKAKLNKERGGISSEPSGSEAIVARQTLKKVLLEAYGEDEVLVDKFFGYRKEVEGLEFLGEDIDNLVCMAGRVTKFGVENLPTQDGKIFPLGKWIISAGKGEEPTTFYGPFDDMETTFNYGSDHLGVVSWRGRG